MLLGVLVGGLLVLELALEVGRLVRAPRRGGFTGLGGRVVGVRALAQLLLHLLDLQFLGLGVW